MQTKFVQKKAYSLQVYYELGKNNMSKYPKIYFDEQSYSVSMIDIQMPVFGDN